MKKNLLAIAVGAAFVAPGVAFADFKVYGKFNIAVDNQKDEIGLDSAHRPTGVPSGTKPSSERNWTLQDQLNSSRVGVKGSDDLGIAELKGIFQVELGINPDGSECNNVVTGVTASGANPVNTITTSTSCQERTFTQRNTFVGVQGGFGTVKAGKFDTPVKEAGVRSDQFNDESIGDIQLLMVGETRANNMIQYSSPKLGDAFTINVAVAPGEFRKAVDDNADADTGLADTIYASAVYDTKLIYAAVSYADSEAGSVRFDGPTAGFDIIRANVAFSPITDFEIGALYQQAKGIDQDGATNGNENGSDAKETSYLVSLGYTIEAFKLKGQYGQTKGDTTDIKRSEMAFGVDYKLSKAVVTQLYYVNYEDQDRVVNSVTDPKTSSYGVGLVYTF